MSIEDLDYLYKNSVQENIIILVDSAKRDPVFWPSPNKFRIDFSEPFKYVYGVDILDITIPRTMYSIDYNSNKMFLKVGVSIDNEDTIDYTMIEFINRDYTLKELIGEMSLETHILFQNNIAVTIDDNISVGERKSIIVYSNLDNPPKPFIFDMKQSSINEILGFSEIARDIHVYKYHKYYHMHNEYLFASIPKYIEQFKRQVTWEFSDNVFEIKNMTETDTPNTDTNYIDDEFNNGYIYTHLNTNSYKYQSYYITYIRLENQSFSTGIHVCDFYVYKLDYSDIVFTDKFTKDDVINSFKDVNDKTDVSSFITGSNISESNIELVCKRSFSTVGSNLVFSIDKEQKNPYYFQSIPIKTTGNVFYLVYVGAILHNNSGNTQQVAEVEIDIIDSFNLTSPGLVQLSGERYITVHCDEIENDLRGSMMYNHYSPGLAMLNMGVQGFSENRIDFYSVKYKEFHPIGKLTGMVFSINTPNNELYDLKNVNWHMLVSIKYYVPKKLTSFNHSTLNPNYNYNFIQYQIDKHKNNQGKSSDDDDEDDGEPELSEDDFNDRFIRKEIALKEAYYDYDTLTDSDETTSSDD
jgi:hypothetical protein